MTTVENVKVANIRKKGYNDLKEWLSNPDHIYIGRPRQVFIDNKRFPEKSSGWENPFTIKQYGDRDTVCEKYKEYVKSKPEMMKKLEELRGKTLGCWCKPERCHGDVLVELLEEISESKEFRKDSINFKIVDKLPNNRIDFDPEKITLVRKEDMKVLKCFAKFYKVNMVDS